MYAGTLFTIDYQTKAAQASMRKAPYPYPPLSPQSSSSPSYWKNASDGSLPFTPSWSPGRVRWYIVTNAFSNCEKDAEYNEVRLCNQKKHIL